VRRLRACTPNRSDGSGTRKAAAARVSIYTLSGHRSRAIAPLKETLHFAPEFRHRRIQSFQPRIDDDGTLWVQPIEMAANGFPEPPPDTIPHHGLTQRTRHGETDVRSIRLRLADAKGREQGAGETRALVINPSEILRSQQTDTFRKTGDGNYLSELTVSFLRPRARRRDSTARPSWVCIRFRKPWVFARWRLFG